MVAVAVLCYKVAACYVTSLGGWKVAILLLLSFNSLSIAYRLLLAKSSVLPTLFTASPFLETFCFAAASPSSFGES